MRNRSFLETPQRELREFIHPNIYQIIRTRFGDSLWPRIIANRNKLIALENPDLGNLFCEYIRETYKLQFANEPENFDLARLVEVIDNIKDSDLISLIPNKSMEIFLEEFVNYFL